MSLSGHRPKERELAATQLRTRRKSRNPRRTRTPRYGERRSARKGVPAARLRPRGGCVPRLVPRTRSPGCSLRSAAVGAVTRRARMTDVLVLGGIAREVDVVAGGGNHRPRLGGSALIAALVAARLGGRVSLAG